MHCRRRLLGITVDSNQCYTFFFLIFLLFFQFFSSSSTPHFPQLSVCYRLNPATIHMKVLRIAVSSRAHPAPENYVPHCAIDKRCTVSAAKMCQLQKSFGGQTPHTLKYLAIHYSFMPMQNL